MTNAIIEESSNSSIDAPLEEIIVPMTMFMGRKTYAPHDQNRDDGLRVFKSAPPFKNAKLGICYNSQAFLHTRLLSHQS